GGAGSARAKGSRGSGGGSPRGPPPPRPGERAGPPPPPRHRPEAVRSVGRDRGGIQMRRRPVGLRRRRWSELRERRRQTIFLLPGLLTTGNLLCGFYAIVLTLGGHHEWAASSLFVAMVMDSLDGKVARLTRTTTQFGVEFASLADVVSFGVAPGLLLYSWALAPLGRVGAGAAFLYVICGALRLARFNVLTGVTDRRYFIGLPIPGAAGTV